MIIHIEQDIYDRLQEGLASMPEQIPNVLRRTINETARGAKKSVITNVKERYLLKHANRRVKEASEFESARGKNFQATITIKGSPEPLMHFNVRKNGKKVSAKARVLNTSGLKGLTLKADGKQYKAFVLKIENTSKEGVKSHHVGVFRRMTEAEKVKQQAYFDRQAAKGKGQKTTQWNAVKQLYSTSIPQMVKNDGVYPKIEKEIKEELRANLEKHIAKVMEGL